MKPSTPGRKNSGNLILLPARVAPGTVAHPRAVSSRRYITKDVIEKGLDAVRRIVEAAESKFGADLSPSDALVAGLVQRFGREVIDHAEPSFCLSDEEAIALVADFLARSTHPLPAAGKRRVGVKAADTFRNRAAAAMLHARRFHASSPRSLERASDALRKLLDGDQQPLPAKSKARLVDELLALMARALREATRDGALSQAERANRASLECAHLFGLAAFKGNRTDDLVLRLPDGTVRQDRAGLPVLARHAKAVFRVLTNNERGTVAWLAGDCDDVSELSRQVVEALLQSYNVPLHNLLNFLDSKTTRRKLKTPKGE